MKESQIIYLVRLYKVDSTSVDLVETTEFNKAKEVWKESYEQWTASVAERRPFVIEEPSDNGFITAFDPSLICEIAILPVGKQPKEANPYQRRMQQEGFGGTFPGGGSDIIDGGYK